MKYQWDEHKRQTNLIKHGFDFTDVALFDWEAACIEQDMRCDYGEPRYNAYGHGQADIVMVLTFTVRENTTRIISYRKANARERRKYA